MPELNPVITNLVSGTIGALFGAWVSGWYIIWQARENAKHELRGIVLCMGVHAQHCKGNDKSATDPWFEIMAPAIAAFQRYRALVMPWKRRVLDGAWTSLQGTNPSGDEPFHHEPLLGQSGVRRVQDFLKAIA